MKGLEMYNYYKYTLRQYWDGHTTTHQIIGSKHRKFWLDKHDVLLTFDYGDDAKRCFSKVTKIINQGKEPDMAKLGVKYGGR